MIDVHLLTLPHEREDWREQCLDSLRGQPVTVHVVPGIEGDIGQARYEAFQRGEHPYVAFADPDDLVLPGAYAACLDALEASRMLAAAYMHEYVVGEALVLQPDKISTLPHHLIVFRRAALAAYLPLLLDWRWPQPVSEGRMLVNALARNHPVLEIPTPGYLWRRHNSSFLRLAALARLETPT